MKIDFATSRSIFSFALYSDKNLSIETEKKDKNFTSICHERRFEKIRFLLVQLDQRENVENQRKTLFDEKTFGQTSNLFESAENLQKLTVCFERRRSSQNSNRIVFI